MNKRLRHILQGYCAFAVFALPAYAQTLPTQGVFVEELGAAQAYDVGVIDYGQGALGPDLWSGTSLQTALIVISDAPLRSDSAATVDLAAISLLSGGTPPAGAQDNNDYTALRLGKLIEMGRGPQAEQILDRLPNLSNSPLGQEFKADKALVQGQTDQACSIADTVQQVRAEAYWAKLRAFCHVVREEIPAAELTADLLRSSGHEAPEFYKALRQSTGLKAGGDIIAGDDPLLNAMSAFLSAPKDASQTPDSLTAQDQLDAFVKDAPSLSAQDFSARLMALSLTEEITDTDPQNAGYFDLEPVLESEHPSSWGKLYGVVKTGTDVAVSAKAAAALLERADQSGVFNILAKAMASDLEIIPNHIKAQYNVDVFARLAVLNSDLMGLRTLYDAVEQDDPRKVRIALASDALGNGFVLGTLGQDMTDRLQLSGTEKRRAIRDTYIAVNLGAKLSDDAISALSKYTGHMQGRKADAAELLLLQAASARGAKAETALRAAAILGEDGPKGLSPESFGAVLKALGVAGLQEWAGRLAAEDFIRG